MTLTYQAPTDTSAPTLPYMPQFRKEDKKFKRKQKRNYDKHRRTQALPDLPEGQKVWITSGPTPVKGTVVASSPARLSYQVETDGGLLRRNWYHLNPAPADKDLFYTQCRAKRDHDTIQNRYHYHTKKPLPGQINLRGEMWHKLLGCDYLFCIIITYHLTWLITIYHCCYKMVCSLSVYSLPFCLL